jgi:hypothetical protein
MAEKKGKKLRRCARHSAYYKVQMQRGEVNKKRRLGRHIRRFPEDKQAIEIYEVAKKYGPASGHIANMTMRATRRGLREADRVFSRRS